MQTQPSRLATRLRNSLILPELFVFMSMFVSGQTPADKDTTSYGNLVIKTIPQNVRFEIPALNIDMNKTDLFLRVDFIPPGKYLARVSAKDKILEYAADIHPYMEYHRLFNLKKREVIAKGEYMIPRRITTASPGGPDSLAAGDRAKNLMNDFSEIFTMVEEQPCFPGGEEARIRFLAKNVQYPPIAIQNKTQGRVFVTFVAEKMAVSAM